MTALVTNPVSVIRTISIIPDDKSGFSFRLPEAAFFL